MRKLNYKKIMIWGISFFPILGIIISLVIFFVSNNKSISTSTTDAKSNVENINIENTIIPNVSKKNTTFKLSDTKKQVESVNISATNRLSEYNLCYYLKFDNTTEIKNEDYLIFNDLLLILDENCTICFKYELNGVYSDKSYEIKISNIKVLKEESEKATEKELKEEKVSKTEVKKSTLPYYIKVNYTANVVTVYTKDKDGNFTVPYKAMVCSCGTYTPTSGTYKTSNKYTWRLLINNVYGQYATRIVGSILFHSVPYTSNKKDTLEYWEYDKLGKTASAGCVRLTVRDAKWIYDNCPRGTMVEFYSDSNPGPLGKPSAQKISSNEECKNWDPTDPASENPWHTYTTKKEESNTNDNTNTINNNTVTNTTITNSTISENINNSDNNTNINTNVNNATNNIIITNTTNQDTSNNSNNSVSENETTSNNAVINNSVSTNNNTSNNITNDSNSDNDTFQNSSSNNTAPNTINTDSTNNYTNSGDNNVILNEV